MPPVALQARPATGLIDTGIIVLRRRYWELFLAELIPTAPVLLLAVFVSSAAIRYVQLATVVTVPVATGIVAWLVSQEFTGETVTLGTAVRRAMRRAPGLIGVRLVSGLIIALGLIGLIVGGFVAAAWMYSAMPVYTLENTSVSAAIDRSMALARGNVLHVLGVLLGSALGYLIVELLARWVIAWVWGAATHVVYIPVRVDTLVVMIVTLGILPFYHVFPTVVYYDLRVRREGMDIEAMTAALGDSARAPVDAAPA